MITESLKATGELQITLRDANGNIKEQKTVPNLVVTVGRNAIASRLTGTATAVMSHMSVGTSSTAPSIAHTTLIAEIGGSRTGLTVAGGTAVANEVTYACTFPGGVGTGAVTEAGLFNAGSGGTMLARTVFSVVNKDAADALTISWKISIT
jgi:azurin